MAPKKNPKKSAKKGKSKRSTKVSRKRAVRSVSRKSVKGSAAQGRKTVKGVSSRRSHAKAARKKASPFLPKLSRKDFIKATAAAFAGAAIAGSGIARAQFPGYNPLDPVPPPYHDFNQVPQRDVSVWPIGDTGTVHQTINVEWLINYVHLSLADPNRYPFPPPDTGKFNINCTADLSEIQGAFLRVWPDSSFTIRCIDGQYRRFYYAENPFKPEDGREHVEDPENPGNMIPNPDYNPSLLPSMHDPSNPNNQGLPPEKYGRVQTLILMPFTVHDPQNPVAEYTPFYFDFANPLNADSIVPAVFVDHPYGLYVEGDFMRADPEDPNSPILTYSGHHPDLDGQPMKTEIKRGPNCHGNVFAAVNLWGKGDPGWYPPEEHYSRPCLLSSPPPPPIGDWLNQPSGYQPDPNQGPWTHGQLFGPDGPYNEGESPYYAFVCYCAPRPPCPPDPGCYLTSPPSLPIEEWVNEPSSYTPEGETEPWTHGQLFGPGGPYENMQYDWPWLCYCACQHDKPCYLNGPPPQPIESWLNERSNFPNGPGDPGNLTHGQLFEPGNPYEHYGTDYQGAFNSECFEMGTFPPMKVAFKDIVCTGSAPAPPPEEGVTAIGISRGYTDVEFLDLTIVDFHNVGILATSCFNTTVDRFSDPNQPAGPGCILVPGGPSAIGVLWTGMWGLAFGFGRPFYGGRLSVQNSTLGTSGKPLSWTVQSYQDDYSMPLPGQTQRIDIRDNLLHGPLGIGFATKLYHDPYAQWLNIMVPLDVYEHPSYPGVQWTHGELFTQKGIDGMMVEGPYQALYGFDYQKAWDDNCNPPPPCFLSRSPEGVPLSQWLQEESLFPPELPAGHPGKWVNRQLFEPMVGPYGAWGADYWRAWGELCESQSPHCYMSRSPPLYDERLQWLDAKSLYPNGPGDPGNWTHRELFEGRNGQPGPYESYGDRYNDAWAESGCSDDPNIPSGPDCYLSYREPLHEWLLELSTYPPDDPNKATHRRLFNISGMPYYDSYGPKYQDVWDAYNGEPPPCYLSSPPPADPGLWLEQDSTYSDQYGVWTHRELFDGKDTPDGHMPGPYGIFRHDYWLAWTRSCAMCYLVSPPPPPNPPTNLLRTWVENNQVIGDFGDLNLAAMYIHGENTVVRSNAFHGNGTGVLLWPVPLDPSVPYFRNFVVMNDFTDFTPHGELYMPGIALPDGTPTLEQNVPVSAFIWLFPGADANIINRNRFGFVEKMTAESDFAAIWVMGDGNLIGQASEFGWPNEYQDTGLPGFKMSAAGIIRPGCIFLDQGTQGNIVDEHAKYLPPDIDVCTQVLDMTFSAGMFANQHVFPDLLSCDSKEYEQMLKLVGVYLKVSELVPPQSKRPMIWTEEDIYPD